MKLMAASKFPFFGANMRQADGSPIPGMKDSEIFTLGQVKVGVDRPRPRHDAADVAVRRLKFANELETLRAPGRKAAPGGRGYPRGGRPYRSRHGQRHRPLAPRRRPAVRPRPRPRHRLRRQDGDGREQRGRQLRHRDRLRRAGDRRGQGPQGRLVAELPRARFLHRRSRPGGRRRGEEATRTSSARSSTSKSAPPRANSTAARPSCARRKRRSATSSPTRSGPRPGPTSPSPMAAASAPTSSIRRARS